MNALRLLALLLTACLGVSCIDVREEVWLRDDGSGRVRFECSLPSTAAAIHGGDDGIANLIADFLEGTPEISTSSHQIHSARGKTNLLLDFSFDSALDMTRVAAAPSTKRSPDIARHFVGDIAARLNGRDIAVTRTMTPGNAIPGSRFLPHGRLKGHTLTHILHLPAAATSSNATRTADNGRTLIWETPLNQALKHPVTTRFQYSLPIPRTLVTGLALLAVLTLWLLASFLRRRQHHRHAPPHPPALG